MLPIVMFIFASLTTTLFRLGMLFILHREKPLGY
ncbi:unnamed protein product [Brugia timori]|uniref:Na+/H+ antiporter subunit G n=1 Tax=Brugia timori TaxID=42155 RepID=A0A0R3Q7M5_9BILA|nr:unnamed protein product [Brugia timori]